MPTTPVVGGVSAVKAGAELMVMVIDGLTALGAVPLDAVTAKVNGPVRNSSQRRTLATLNWTNFAT